MPSFDSLHKDFIFALRHLRRAPGFFAAAALTLSLGIGATTAMFAVVHGVLLKPLPFDEPERLVSVWSTAPGIGWPRAVLAPAQYFAYRDDNRVFEDIAVWTERPVTVTGRGEPERLAALFVTDGFLPLLRVRPEIGRRFTPGDDQPGAPSRVIVTHGYWQQRLGADPAIVGRRLVVNDGPAEIVGVLPRDFRFHGTKAALLIPLAFNRAATRIQDFSYTGLARLKAGVTLEQANKDVGRLIPVVEQKFPASPALGPSWFKDSRFGPDVHALASDEAEDVGPVLWLLMGTIGIVLVIACANVANLFLVRADGRQQELAVRAALGAGRGRLAAALLSESLVLGFAGGAVGIGVAAALIRLVRATAPDALPRVEEITVDPVVVLFAAVLSVSAALLFGLVPVLKWASPRLGALSDGGRAASASRARHRTRHVLVVSEVALALVLLIASGLMIRTFQALRQVNPGFVKGDQVLMLDLAIPRALAAEPNQVARRHKEIADRLARVPGVESVGMTSAVAASGGGMSNPMLIEDFPQPEGQVVRSRRMKWIAPGYFETMGNRLVAGRPLTWADLSDGTPVVLINERMAREHWKTPAAAVGRRVRESARNPWREIIGVVGDEHDDGLAQPAPGLVYYPYFVRNFWTGPLTAIRSLSYVVRSPRAGTEAFAREVRRAVWEIGPDLPLANVETLDRVLAKSMAQASFTLVMLALAAGVSLLLGLVGIYGVMSYVAAQRTREIGVRMALGARPRDITGLFVRQGLWLAGGGVATGAAAAGLLSRLMSSLLFGVSPTDPATYLAVAAGLTGVTLLAGYLPARRAARNEPVVALRAQG